MGSAKWWFAVLHFSIFSILHTAAAAFSNETDREALLQFKAKITGDPFRVLSSWNDSTPFCQWYGVTCSTRDQRVTVLNLPSLKLSGSLSPHIGNLSFLTDLVIYNNSFTNGIPPEIGRLQRLEVIGLLNNSFTGVIPSNISACSALVKFHVAYNGLEGELPWQMGSMNMLQFLIVAGNNLRGIIPPSYGNLSSLQMFAAADNHLTGTIPHGFGQLKNLWGLSVEINSLYGEIPPSIFNISTLMDVHFSMNQFHGSLPGDLGLSLPRLRSLSVALNGFTGSIPPSLSNASNLIEFQMQDNNFTGSMPSMGSSRNLMRFFIQNNSLGTGLADDLSFISSLTNASSLVFIDIADNNFGGTIPEHIGNLATTLTTLQLSGNKITGRIPSGIENLVSLYKFEAFQNNLSGTIPSTIGNMNALVLLDLSSNGFSGYVPSSLGNLTRLIKLSLASNYLHGEIPAAIANCQNLIVFDLSANNLSGNIPPQVMGLTSLSILMNLSRNHFTGAIPDQVGRLRNLGSLDLSHNMLSGTIPASLGSCVRLESLMLQGNLLQGHIPPSLSSLRGVQKLDVSRNNLSGQIPKFFGEFRSLELLNMSYNNFEGEVPGGGRAFKSGSTISVNGNDDLCGGSAELHLPPCKFKHLKRRRLNHIWWKVLVSVISCLLFLTFIASCLILCRTRKMRRRRRRNQHNIDSSVIKWEYQLSYQSLYKATNGFSSSNLIGMGSFGTVYKAVLRETTVAVKVFNLERSGASKSFIAECEALRNIRHRNLMKIVTVCSSVDRHGNDFKAVIYEFFANGSLEDWLHPEESSNSFDFPKRLTFLQRLNVAIDVASALDYLHHQCQVPLAHCDLKPSNILIDEDMTAHVGDFGLARFLTSISEPSSAGQTSSTGLKGTIGYAPPGKSSSFHYSPCFQVPIVLLILIVVGPKFAEYGTGNEVSIQGDVYSYGILLLEMFTGMRPTDANLPQGLSLHKLVENALLHKAAEVVDPALLGGNKSHGISGNDSKHHSIREESFEEVLTNILEVGVACSSDLPQERFSISEVASKLLSVRNKLLDFHDMNIKVEKEKVLNV
ncbi:Probable LRR receptor-like serine/threonine-protein kinase At3g47570 [Linum perenne]